MLPDIGYEYYRFGSKDSLDFDVLINHPNATGVESNNDIIETINFINPITKNWNINIIKIANGTVIYSIPSKGSPDGVNNSLYETYHLHQQKHGFPLSAKVKRNVDLAVERCIGSLLTFYKKTNHNDFYNEVPRTVLKPLGSLQSRVAILREYDFNMRKPFDDEKENIERFKKIAFHIAQTISLIAGVEIYTKQECVYYHPNLLKVIKRVETEKLDPLNESLQVLLDKIM